MLDIVVADKYRMPKLEGKFSKAQQKLVRKGAKVTKDYIDRMNAQSKQNGVYYVIDKAATKAWEAKHLKQLAARKEAKRKAKQGIDILNKAIDEAKNQEGAAAEPEPEPSTETTTEEIPPQQKGYAVSKDLELITGRRSDLKAQLESREILFAGSQKLCKQFIENNSGKDQGDPGDEDTGKGSDSK